MSTTVKSSQRAGDTTDFDRQMMSQALELAARGAGLVSPGPLVGCVISLLMEASPVKGSMSTKN